MSLNVHSTHPSSYQKAAKHRPTKPQPPPPPVNDPDDDGDADMAVRK